MAPTQYVWLVMALTQNLLALVTAVSAYKCTPDAIPFPELPGAQILNLSAAPVQNYSTTTVPDGEVLAANLTGLSFCDVNITYTHLGQNDELHVGIWLPLSGWNGRYQGTGGGGWYTGLREPGLPWAVSQGYAAGYTDGGHSTEDDLVTPDHWGLVGPGNVNLYALQDFASVGLHDLAILGKAVTTSFYGTPPKYSYWNGCSTGGRQGLMLAQRYPEDYNGIVALSPAVNWDTVLLTGYYGQFLMNQLQIYPPQCEFEAITTAAIAACDALDGVTDGIISSPELCSFDPHTVIGKLTNCPNGGPQAITSAAASIVSGVWTGALSTNGSLLGGSLRGGPFNKDAPLASPTLPTILNTTCISNPSSCNNTTTPTTNCTGNPFAIFPDWIRIFLRRDPAFDPNTLTHPEYDRLVHASVNEYRSVIGTADPDLRPFRDAGGKMVTWHGMADPLLSPASARSYYEVVSRGDPGRVGDYYRFFEAPGTGHCLPGRGPYPRDVLGVVRRWVEEGEVPERLLAEAEGQKKEEEEEEKESGGTGRVTVRRELCPWPLKQRYVGGDPNLLESFDCV